MYLHPLVQGYQNSILEGGHMDQALWGKYKFTANLKKNTFMTVMRHSSATVQTVMSLSPNAFRSEAIP